MVFAPFRIPVLAVLSVFVCKYVCMSECVSVLLWWWIVYLYKEQLCFPWKPLRMWCDQADFEHFFCIHLLSHNLNCPVSSCTYFHVNTKGGYRTLHEHPRVLFYSVLFQMLCIVTWKIPSCCLKFILLAALLGACDQNDKHKALYLRRSVLRCWKESECGNSTERVNLT